MSSSATLTTLPAPAYGETVSKTGWKAATGVGGFFILWLFLWVLFFSFRPSIVRYCDESWPYPRSEGVCDNRPADPARCLVASLILTVIIFIIIWIIAAAK